MSCRVAMLRMHRDRLIQLPAPRRRHSNGTLHRRRTPQAEPELPIIARVDELPALQVRPLADQREAQLWREYVDRYHYLGYTPLPGAQMRYLVTSQRRVLAVVGFGASAWKAAPRDRFIGWSVAQREARLQLVVNNARFLILPWVQVRNLASTVLACSSRRLPDDWQARYGYRPLLLETFVQSDRFPGTSYRAANWTHVGQTRPRQTRVHRTHALPRNDIWLYPLRRDFRRRLATRLSLRPSRRSRSNHAAVNTNAKHPAPWSAASARVGQCAPRPTVTNPPALPQMRTKHRRDALTPPTGVRLRPAGPRKGVPAKM